MYALKLSYAKFYKCLMKAPSRQVPATAKLVLCALLDLRELGVLNPKIELLERHTGEAGIAIKRALKRLRVSGLLQTAKGQRQNSYRIAPFEDWAKILRYQNEPAEPNPAVSKRPGARYQFDTAETPPPYLVQDSFSRLDKPPLAAFESRARENGATNGHRAAAAAPPSSKAIKTSELCRELLSKHPHPQQPEKAEVELRRALQSSTADEIRQRHSAWCAYWEANPKHFVPHLWRWFADGDWLVTPRQPAKKLTVLEQLRRMTAAK